MYKFFILLILRYTKISMSESLINSIFKIPLQEDETYHSNSVYKDITNRIKMGNINPNGDITETPDNMSITLKLHQKRVLNEMLKKESIDYRVMSSINGFVLADKVGAGKSLDVLALISHSKIVDQICPNRLVYKPNRYSDFRGLKLEPTVEFKTNLIVVPHGIYNQWMNYITQFTNLSYFGISYNRDIDKLPLDSMKNGTCDILLVKSTRFNDLMSYIYSKYPCSLSTSNPIFESQSEGSLNDVKENLYSVYSDLREHNFSSTFISKFSKLKESIELVNINQLEKDIKKAGKFKLDYLKVFNGPIFQRVFIDEANSIKIPKCKSVYGKVNWFITSSVEDLLQPWGKKDYYGGKVLINGIKGSGFIKDIFANNSGKNFSNFIQDYYIKNDDKFVEESFQLPEPNIIKHPCYTPPELKALQGVAVPEVIQALNAGDMVSAISQAGCVVHSETSIVDMVLKNLNTEYDTKKSILNDREIKLAACLENIDSTSDKISDLKSLLSNNESDTSNFETETIESQIDEYTYILEDNRTNRNNIKKSIKLYTEQINNLKFKIDALKSRITNIDEKDCPVCTQKVVAPCMTPCCKNIFCIPRINRRVFNPLNTNSDIPSFLIIFLIDDK